MTTPTIAEVAGKLSDAQRRAVRLGNHGYCDDDSLYSSERRMLYRLIDAGLFAHNQGFGRRPDITLTPLGLAIREYLSQPLPATPAPQGE